MPDILIAGNVDFLGGQDASKIPDRIAENAYAAGVNVTVSKGILSPRWGFERLSIVYPDQTILNPFKLPKTVKNVFEAGKFQAAAPYFVGNTPYIIFVVAGFIFALNINTNNLIHIELDDGTTLNTRASRVNWSSAGKYLIFYDFPAFPVIIQGLQARRADPNKQEIPVSTIGAFNQNRLFIGNNGSEFTGGDPVGSLAAPNAPITFEEVLTPSSPYFGQIFQLPTSDHNDPITYMGFLQATDISTGIGPLIIATNSAVYSYNTQNPRISWEQGQFGSLLCYNAGVAGPRAFTNSNSDAFFLAEDGYVRSLSMSRSEQQTWSRIPISREVVNWFKMRDKALTQFGFISYFNNKVFVSVNPYRTSAIDFNTNFTITDYTHGGVVVMELDNLTSFGQAAPPVWAGLWTGIRPSDMVNLGNRAFVISRDLSSINRVYEVNPDITYDTSDNNIRYVKSKIYTRDYVFAESESDSFSNKELHSLDVNLEKIQGDFSLQVNYKPSHGYCFLPWVNFTHKAPWRECKVPLTCISGYAGHTIRDLTFGAPDPSEDCSPLTQDYYRVFTKVQLEIILQGKYWEMHEFRLKAIPKPKNPNVVVCDEYPIVDICECCNDDWNISDFESCVNTVT